MTPYFRMFPVQQRVLVGCSSLRIPLQFFQVESRVVIRSRRLHSNICFLNSHTTGDYAFFMASGKEQCVGQGLIDGWTVGVEPYGLEKDQGGAIGVGFGHATGLALQPFGLFAIAQRREVPRSRLE